MLARNEGDKRLESMHRHPPVHMQAHQRKHAHESTCCPCRALDLECGLARTPEVHERASYAVEEPCTVQTPYAVAVRRCTTVKPPTRRAHLSFCSAKRRHASATLIAPVFSQTAQRLALARRATRPMAMPSTTHVNPPRTYRAPRPPSRGRTRVVKGRQGGRDPKRAPFAVGHQPAEGCAASLA